MEHYSKKTFQLQVVGNVAKQFDLDLKHDSF